MQLPAMDVEDLHAELEPQVIERAKKLKDYTRCILATSFAEACVTIPDVVHVIDAGLSRKANEYHDIVDFYDTTATERAMLQRAGRSGRVMLGAWTLVKLKNAPPPREPRVTIGSLAHLRWHS